MIKLQRREITPVLVSKQDGKLKTDSLIVARVFGKEHCNVLRDINKLECSSDFRALHYIQHYRINTLANGKKEPYYEMTQAGLLFLVTGWSGKKATSFRELYFTEGFEVAWLWVCEEPHNDISLSTDQLYVVLHENGMIKVGKGRSAKARIDAHKLFGKVHNNPVVDYDISLTPNTSEQQLIDFCKRYGDCVGGKEYFSNLKFKDVVRFMKLQKLPRHKTVPILPYCERLMQQAAQAPLPDRHYRPSKS